MSKMIALITGLLISFVSPQVLALKTLALNPSESKMLTNSAPWTVNATCSIKGSKQNKIKLSVLKNTGTINGKKVGTGQTKTINLDTNSSISVSAESGTQINLINLGADPFQVTCS